MPVERTPKPNAVRAVSPPSVTRDGHGLTVAVQGLEIGSNYVAKSEAVSKMAGEREFASLSDARVITESDFYWIGPKSKEVAPSEVQPIQGGRAYEARTFEGVPSIPGEFKDNGDRTFTQLLDFRDAEWTDRIRITMQAAYMAARDERPLELEVNGSPDHSLVRLVVHSGEWANNKARVASVLKAQADKKADLPHPRPD